MVTKNPISYRYLFFQAIVLLLIISVPLHFFINSELENNRFKEEIALQQYANRVASKIYQFSSSTQTEFYFPRSSLFEGAIYGADGAPIFSLLKEDGISLAQNFAKENGYLYFALTLEPNVLEARTLVVAKKVSHAKLILNVLAILMVTALLVFLMLFFIIKQSTEPYKRFNLYLENFIKDAMHEMKTPMGVILLNLDGLGAIYENNTMIQRAKSALKNMIVVYEDLEFFVRKKRVEHPKQEIDFSSFLRERILFFSDLLHSKEIEVVSDIEEDIALMFSQLELSRIVDNTLSNAIKYSKNSTTIHIALWQEEESVVLSVQDEGRGIKEVEKIFERYYRGDKISGGFGLGLSIVKAICVKNNIEIRVHSEVGVGSKFTYLVPK